MNESELRSVVAQADLAIAMATKRGAGELPLTVAPDGGPGELTGGTPTWSEPGDPLPLLAAVGLEALLRAFGITLPTGDLVFQARTVVAALGLGILNKLLEGWAGAVLAKIMILVFIIVFIQKRPQGLFALKGRTVEA